MKKVEVKINREIRQYTESIFFGLSIRQFAFSICACGVAVILYFLFHGKLNIETITPIEALNTLYKLKEMLKEK